MPRSPKRMSIAKLIMVVLACILVLPVLALWSAPVWLPTFMESSFSIEQGERIIRAIDSGELSTSREGVAKLTESYAYGYPRRFVCVTNKGSGLKVVFFPTYTIFSVRGYLHVSRPLTLADLSSTRRDTSWIRVGTFEVQHLRPGQITTIPLPEVPLSRKVSDNWYYTNFDY